MTNQEINQAIAEACGLTAYKSKEWAYSQTQFVGSWKTWITEERKTIGCWFGRTPNYCTDLNAMREAEVSLDDDTYRSFHYNLTRLRNSEDEKICRCISAPARQRAEAFLRTIGKWRE